MNNILITIIIGISLSMDAFSLSLAYGTLNLSKIKKIVLSISVGIFHFVMPILGNSIGNILIKNIIIDISLLASIIFAVIGIEMIISSIKEENLPNEMNIIGILFFSFGVSIDSFTTGIGIKTINDNLIEVGIIFLLISGITTLIGINIGDYLNKKYGTIATKIGGISLIILGIINFFE